MTKESYVNELEEHYEWEDSLQCIRDIIGETIKAQGKAKDAGNQKLIEKLEEKIQKTMELERQLKKREIRRYIIDNFYALWDEISQIVEANQ